VIAVFMCWLSIFLQRASNLYAFSETQFGITGESLIRCSMEQSSGISTGSSTSRERVTIVSSSAASHGMLAVFNQQHLPDATVVCGSGQQQRWIYTSRAIVAAGSPYFERLFAFNAAAKNAVQEATSISWPDHKPEVARAVLQYLYSDTCSFERSYTDEVLNLAAQMVFNNFKFEALLTQILKASTMRWGCAIPFDEKVSMLHRLYLHESLLSADSFLVHSTEQQLGGRCGIWAHRHLRSCWTSLSASCTSC
jgi:BTB/POZ domain